MQDLCKYSRESTLTNFVLFSSPADKFAHLKLAYKCCAYPSAMAGTSNSCFCAHSNLMVVGLLAHLYVLHNVFGFQNAVMLNKHN